jgi:hypothetical protein
MIIAVLVVFAVICYFVGCTEDQSEAPGIRSEKVETTEEKQFDPWVDEWYGEGPWWKKW